MRRGWAFRLSALLLYPGLVYAHTPIQGVNHLFNGILHPLFVPSHILLILVTGLFYGQRLDKSNQQWILVFIAATLVGLSATWVVAAQQFTVVIPVCVAIIGILVAFKYTVGALWYSLLPGLSGFALGMDSSQEELSGFDRLMGLSGTALITIVLLFCTMDLTMYCRKKNWQATGIRVVGSWITASALLVLSLEFAPKP